MTRTADLEDDFALMHNDDPVCPYCGHICDDNDPFRLGAGVEE